MRFIAVAIIRLSKQGPSEQEYSWSSDTLVFLLTENTSRRAWQMCPHMNDNVISDILKTLNGLNIPPEARLCTTVQSRRIRVSLSLWEQL